MAASARTRLCAAYQYPRERAGTTGCGHARGKCPYGAHLCAKCGKWGHGFFDCTAPLSEQWGNDWYKVDGIPFHYNVPKPPPPPKSSTEEKRRRVAPPTPPAIPDRSSRSAIATGSDQPYASSVPPPEPTVSKKEKPFNVFGAPAKTGGHKGYGKGNYGTPIPVPQRVDCADPIAAPPPFPATSADVTSWMEAFTPFHPTNCTPPEVGQDVLWRGFKKGRNGNTSTRCEYFNGTVHGLDIEDDELYVYVS